MGKQARGAGESVFGHTRLRIVLAWTVLGDEELVVRWTVPLFLVTFPRQEAKVVQLIDTGFYRLAKTAVANVLLCL